MRRPFTCITCGVAGLSGERGVIPARCKPCDTARRAGLVRPVGASARDTAITLEVALGIRSLKEIGFAHGLTRERVRQIAKREGVSRERRKRPGMRRISRTLRCRDCRTRVRVGQMRTHRLSAGHTARSGSRLTQAHLDLIREFYERGLGYRAIGKVLAMHPINVKWHVVRLDLPRHQVGQYQRGGVVPALKREMASRLQGVACATS